jgi:limonene-1,2-epoxide hydrolase
MTFWACGTFEIRDGKIAVWRDRFDRTSIALELIASPFRRLAARLASS